MEKTLNDFQSQWEDLCIKASSEDKLSQQEKVWLYAQSLLQQVLNGGMISYFYNSGADNYEETLKALDALSAQNVKELLLEMASLFPDEIQKLDINARNLAVSTWQEKEEETSDRVDESFAKLRAEFEEKIVNYIGANHLA